ncbi:sensor histidine kinase [Flavobacteriaceae bacterium TP-CH-4]|uniref:Sensor histidine kinase n=1 Tax=Pelagihabitans pacificus TaxID=2696054 RepID=A0A967E6T7_9FLAO|nr:histidine kinase [Pelagihabitans pacificus]NHF59955.1 sensor histidine kinase [Pelagihabitans pacificus]
MIDRVLNSNNSIYYHILFWMAYLALYTLMWGSYDEEYWQQFQILLFLLPWKMIPTYITLYYLMPTFLYPKKMVQYVSLSILLAIAMGLIDRYMTWAYIYHWFSPEKEHWKTPMLYFPKVLNSIVAVYTPVFVAMAIKLQLFYYQKDKVNKELEKEKVATELKFLKAQIHPHFLFNTLNSIYSLSLSQSKKTPEVVLGLSKFLDYMLYECNERFIPIGREWEQLMNLVALERIRYGEGLSINVSESIDNTDTLIPSLLLLPFVENAFKHGADNELSDSWITIDLKLTGNQLVFMVENSKSSVPSEKSLDTDKNIGLTNVKRRLDLFFPEKHELKIFEEKDSFLVKLSLDLSGIPDLIRQENVQ